MAAEKGTGSHGPLRGNAYVRVTARFDYQPDVCKDYKETGYCSYGDTCKFMHDRGDYKSGWELDKVTDVRAPLGGQVAGSSRGTGLGAACCQRAVPIR